MSDSRYVRPKLVSIYDYYEPGFVVDQRDDGKFIVEDAEGHVMAVCSDEEIAELIANELFRRWEAHECENE